MIKKQQIDSLGLDRVGAISSLLLLRPVCFLFVAALLAGCGQAPPPKSEAAILAERAALDAGLWKPERLAQQYETRIVALWDEIRQSEDRFSVLAKQALSRVYLPVQSGDKQLSNGIRERLFVASEEALDAAGFRQRLTELSADHRILQTEWHHASFSMTAAGEAVSTVSAAMHLLQGKRRIIVKAMLAITWARQASATDIPEADVIRVTAATILDRDAPPYLPQVAEIDARTLESPTLSLQPLIVYDLDGNQRPEVILGGVNVIMRSQGPQGFKREPLLSHWPGEISESALVADLTGDGRLDFLCVSARAMGLELFPGDADGRFTLPSFRPSDVRVQNPSVITAGDIDGDGDLDLWLTQYVGAYTGGQMPTPYYDANDGHPSFLLINRGDGHFDDQTAAWGLEARRNRRTYASSLVDLDNDDDLDLIVVSDFAGTDLYSNDGNRFVDVRDDWLGEWHSFGMGHTFDDFDQDGKLDVYVIGMSSTTARRLDHMQIRREDVAEPEGIRTAMAYGNRMYLRRSEGFSEPEFRQQVARTGWSWGCSSFDLENDGDADIYVANGHLSGQSSRDYCTTFWTHDIYTGSSQTSPTLAKLFDRCLDPVRSGAISWNGYEKNVLFIKHEDRFVDVAFLFNVALPADCRGVVAGDLDGDGRSDLLVIEEWAEGAKRGQKLHIFANQAPAGHWIGFRFEEQGHAGHALGARVILKGSFGTRTSAVVAGDSYFSQHPAVAHFGLGDATQVESVEIRWPNGKRVELPAPAIDRYHTIAIPH